MLSGVGAEDLELGQGKFVCRDHLKNLRVANTAASETWFVGCRNRFASDGNCVFVYMNVFGDTQMKS